MFCKSCGNQISEGTRFCTKCGKDTETSQNTKKTNKFFTKRRLVVFGIVAVIIGVSIFAFAYYKKNHESASDKAEKDLEIASSVVNIVCKGETEEEDSGGSGTIISKDGLILTNAHIIPDGAKDTVSCLVILPDPTDGSSDEIYTAYPIVIPDLSEKYDLAFVKVDDVYYDHEAAKAYGEYPKTFAAYDGDKYCKEKEEDVKLGEPVRIYGYPAISGGFALTITDGIVSSLLTGDGLIITSAKISHGNSGGLAVDKNGCRIGIPAMVSSDDSESLGVIISNNLITNFTEEVQAFLKEEK